MINYIIINVIITLLLGLGQLLGQLQVVVAIDQDPGELPVLGASLLVLLPVEVLPLGLFHLQNSGLLDQLFPSNLVHVLHRQTDFAPNNRNNFHLNSLVFGHHLVGIAYPLIHDI